MNTSKRGLRHCRRCNTPTIHERIPPPSAGCAGHILLTAITCGLWIPLGAFLGGLTALTGAGAYWQCTTCGRRN